VSSPRLADLPELLTVDELAQVLRVGRSTAYQIARRLRVHDPALGSLVRVPRRAVEEMLAGEAKAAPLRAVR
jgi:excisionase family DNA binding protein